MCGFLDANCQRLAVSHRACAVPTNDNSCWGSATTLFCVFLIYSGYSGVSRSRSQFLGVCRNSLAGVAVSWWFIETTLAGWVSDSISVCLETRWLGQKPWFLLPGTTLYTERDLHIERDIWIERAKCVHIYIYIYMHTYKYTYILPRTARLPQ